MDYFDIYKGGRFIKTDRDLPVINPYGGENFAATYKAGKAELESAIEQAEDARSGLFNMPVWQRSRVLEQIASKLEENREYHVRLLAKEAGKPWKFALGEIKRAIQTFRVASEEAKRLPGEYLSIDWTAAGEGKEGWVKYFPVGLVAGISPFNFPLNLAAHKIAPTLASGCPIILKPASSTPLSTLALASIVHETDLPKGAFSVLPMDRESGNQLVTDERFAKLTFTGSPEVGWKMKEKAGKKKVTLELGGNAGVIIDKDANIDHAVNRCITGGFAYAGQVCIHTQRIYVEESIFDEFAQKFIKATQKLKMGPPEEETTDITAMIDEENASRVEKWIEEAKNAGAKILTGGTRNKTLVEPTVITHTSNDMKVCANEVFGPVVTLETFRDFDRAVETVNDSRYGLQAGVFTDSIEHMNKSWQNLEVGGVIINDVPTFRVDHMPYGGLKDSGEGREGIKYSIREMMEPRVLVKNA